MERIIKKIIPFAAAHNTPRLMRVAGYARVSSGKDAMLHSLSAQVSYFSDMIQKRGDWEYCGVYIDEAVTGTKDARQGFQDLLADCRAGKIDMIITKTISRFARNTVTLLETVRELKLLGVDVYFENERIHAMSGDGEVMLTILASYAQEESLSVSENCKWRIRKRFEKGELVNLRYMYGYHIEGGNIEINPEQAAIVRMIFNDYISGMGSMLIAEKLNDMGERSYFGVEWRENKVLEILKNEKYTGNALLQKTYSTDHISKKVVRNTGKLPQYYAEGTHPAIIDEAIFKRAQAVMAERRAHFGCRDSSMNRYPFTGIIRCGLCGKNYKRKTTSGKVTWNCTTYLQKGKAACHTKQIPEDTLIAQATEVLGLAEFSGEVFADAISEIQVPEFNKLVFILNDGQRIERVWEDRTRRESWDDEARQIARDRQLEIIRNRRLES